MRFRITFILTMLFFVGVLHWLAFFYLAHPLGNESAFITNLTRPSTLFIVKSFIAHDWYKEIPYQQIVKEALTDVKVPFHVPDFGKLFMVKERFLGAPIWTMSPQILLLLFLDPFTFSVVNLLFMYTIGFVGCLLLRREYRLGLLPFTFLFLIFNFNGYFVAKVSAYGPGQLGYFFLPIFIFLLLRLSKREGSGSRDLREGMLLGIVLAAILFQGSLHLFIELITFVCIWGIVHWRQWRAAIAALATAFLIGAVRVFPAAITFGFEPTQHGITPHGYPLRNPLIFFRALVETTTQLSQPYPFGWWEFSLYISWIGFGLILFFAFWGYVREYTWMQFSLWRKIAIPLFFITIISFGPLKRFLIPDFLPLLNGESLTSRYMIIPLLFVTVIAAVNMNGFLRSTKRRILSITLISGLLLVMAGFLFNHSRLWRMHRIQNEYDFVVANRIFGEVPSESVMLAIQNHSGDTLYVASFWIGLFISVIAILRAAWLLRRMKVTRNLL